MSRLAVTGWGTKRLRYLVLTLALVPGQVCTCLSADIPRTDRCLCITKGHGYLRRKMCAWTFRGLGLTPGCTLFYWPSLLAFGSTPASFQASFIPPAGRRIRSRLCSLVHARRRRATWPSSAPIPKLLGPSKPASTAYQGTACTWPPCNWRLRVTRLTRYRACCLLHR